MRNIFQIPVVMGWLWISEPILKAYTDVFCGDYLGFLCYLWYNVYTKQLAAAIWHFQSIDGNVTLTDRTVRAPIAKFSQYIGVLYLIKKLQTGTNTEIKILKFKI